ncbi:hypothetical protein Bbelb_443690 [Branchiostoma belcheri]|nr:hypothetical protein Bbelb_443690 [Branchiostoma belcheri]
MKPVQESAPALSRLVQVQAETMRHCVGKARGAKVAFNTLYSHSTQTGGGTEQHQSPSTFFSSRCRAHPGIKPRTGDFRFIPSLTRSLPAVSHSRGSPRPWTVYVVSSRLRWIVWVPDCLTKSPGFRTRKYAWRRDSSRLSHSRCTYLVPGILREGSEHFSVLDISFVVFQTCTDLTAHPCERLVAVIYGVCETEHHSVGTPILHRALDLRSKGPGFNPHRCRDYCSSRFG